MAATGPSLSGSNRPHFQPMQTTSWNAPNPAIACCGVFGIISYLLSMIYRRFFARAINEQKDIGKCVDYNGRTLIRGPDGNSYLKEDAVQKAWFEVAKKHPDYKFNFPED